MTRVLLPNDNEIPIRKRWAESSRFVPRRVVQPAQRILAAEAAGGAVMLLAAVIALTWANSPWHGGYTSLWGSAFEVRLGALHLELSLQEAVNDILMVFFFYLAALEIKRELVFGDLRDPRAAALPAVAALGGMVVPAAVFMLVAGGTEGSSGWGIPMATDIAFAVGLVTLLGRRVPLAARTFLLTLAVVDDIGGIVVIAIFYTDQLRWGWLGASAAFVALAAVANRLSIRSYAIYIPLGAAAWFALHESGVHATIAGVVLGLLTPAWSFHDPRRFAAWARPLVDRVEDAFRDQRLTRHEAAGNEAALRDLSRLSAETMSPLVRHEHFAGPWVAFLIVPIFAFANAGVRIVGEDFGNPLTDAVVLAPALGLVLGKSLGILAAAYLAVRLGLGRLPTGVRWPLMAGLATTGGVGFTVALFITNLSFDVPDVVDRAKLGVLLGSLVAGVLGYTIMRLSSRSSTATERAGQPVG